MTAKYMQGMKVWIVPPKDKPDILTPKMQTYVKRTGIVIQSYSVPIREVPGVKKQGAIGDLYFYDVALDDSDEIAKGMPEEALQPYPLRQ